MKKDKPIKNFRDLAEAMGQNPAQEVQDETIVEQVRREEEERYSENVNTQRRSIQNKVKRGVWKKSVKEDSDRKLGEKEAGQVEESFFIEEGGADLIDHPILQPGFEIVNIQGEYMNQMYLKSSLDSSQEVFLGFADFLKEGNVYFSMMNEFLEKYLGIHGLICDRSISIERLDKTPLQSDVIMKKIAETSAHNAVILLKQRGKSISYTQLPWSCGEYKAPLDFLSDDPQAFNNFTFFCASLCNNFPVDHPQTGGRVCVSFDEPFEFCDFEEAGSKEDAEQDESMQEWNLPFLNTPEAIVEFEKFLLEEVGIVLTGSFPHVNFDVSQSVIKDGVILKPGNFVHHFSLDDGFWFLREKWPYKGGLCALMKCIKSEVDQKNVMQFLAKIHGLQVEWISDWRYSGYRFYEESLT